MTDNNTPPEKGDSSPEDQTSENQNTSPSDQPEEKLYTQADLDAARGQASWAMRKLDDKDAAIADLKAKLEEKPKPKEGKGDNSDAFKAMQDRLQQIEDERDAARSELRNRTVKDTVFNAIGEHFTKPAAFEMFWQEQGDKFDVREFGEGKSGVAYANAAWEPVTSASVKTEILKQLQTSHDFLLKNPGASGGGVPQKTSTARPVSTPGPNAGKAEWKEFYRNNPEAKPF